MARIFISHSSINNAQALAVAAWLKTEGWDDYFLDIHQDRGIVPGERWMARLSSAVDRCEAVIILVSAKWIESKYCFAEFYQARNLGKRIFGVLIDDVSLERLPEQMTSEWQLCNLWSDVDPVPFTVTRPPFVAETTVHFPRAGLTDLASGLRAAGLDASSFAWPPLGDPERSPYPGLRALDEGDAAVFFGRDALIVRALDQIRATRERRVEQLFVILGASGSGKSSFLRAGLLPRLASGPRALRGAADHSLRACRAVGSAWFTELPARRDGRAGVRARLCAGARRARGRRAWQAVVENSVGTAPNGFGVFGFGVCDCEALCHRADRPVRGTLLQ